MRLSNIVVRCAGLAGLLVWVGASAYETGTHSEFARQGIRTTQGMGRALTDLGLASVDTELTYGAVTKSIQNWLRQGASDEDDTFSASFARYINHFYDPTPGAPYAGGFTGYLRGLLLQGMPAPEWSLEPAPISGQNYSFRDARGYLFQGLTSALKVDREQNLVRTFQTLGHLVRTIQDMAQPQHTRDDSHALGSGS